MYLYKKKACSNFKPMSDMPHTFSSEPKCSHCAYFSTKDCCKNYLDALEYPDEDC